MPIRESRPVITYENIALFQSEPSLLAHRTGDYDAEIGDPNAQSNLSFIKNVQALSYTFEMQREDIGSLGSKNLLQRRITRQPDVAIQITKNEDFDDLFSNLIPYGEFDSNYYTNLDTDSNFYMFLNKDRGRDTTGNSDGNGTADFLNKECISFGNCFLNNVNISQNIGGVLTSSYSFVGSNVQAEKMQEKVVYYNNFENETLGSFTKGGTPAVYSALTTANINRVDEVGRQLKFVDFAAGSPVFEYAINNTGLDGNKVMKMVDGGSTFGLTISGFTETGIYRMEGKIAFSGHSSARLEISTSDNNYTSNTLRRRIDNSTTPKEFSIVGTIGTGAGMRLTLQGDNNGQDKAVLFEYIKISKINEYQITVPSVDLTRKQIENESTQGNKYDARFNSLSSYYEANTGKLLPSYKTSVNIKRTEFNSEDFIIEKSRDPNPNEEDPTDAKIIFRLRSSYHPDHLSNTQSNTDRHNIEIKEGPNQGSTTLNTAGRGKYMSKLRIVDGEFKIIETGRFDTYSNDANTLAGAQNRTAAKQFLSGFNEGEYLSLSISDADTQASDADHAIFEELLSGFGAREYVDKSHRDGYCLIGIKKGAVGELIYEEISQSNAALGTEDSELPQATVHLKKNQSELFFQSETIQSFDLNLPINRKTIYGLGRKYPVYRQQIYPNIGTFSFNSIVSDLKIKEDFLNDTGIFYEREYDTGRLLTTQDLRRFTDKDSNYFISISGESENGSKYCLSIDNAKLDSENFDSNIGSRSSVDMTYSFDRQDFKRVDNCLNNADRTVLYIDALNRRSVPLDAQSPMSIYNWTGGSNLLPRASATIYDLASSPTVFAYPNNTGTLQHRYRQGTINTSSISLTGQITLSKYGFKFDHTDHTNSPTNGVTGNGNFAVVAMSHDKPPALDDRINDGYQSNFKESFTYLVWSRPTGILGTHTNQVMIGNRFGNEERNSFRLMAGGILHFHTYNGLVSDSNGNLSASSISQNSDNVSNYVHSGWQQFAVTLNTFTGSIGVDDSNFGSVISFYHNAELVSSHTIDKIPHTGISDGVQNTFLGGSHMTNGTKRRLYRGEIGVAAMYSDALSQAQIEENYNRMRGRYDV